MKGGDTYEQEKEKSPQAKTYGEVRKNQSVGARHSFCRAVRHYNSSSS